MIEDDQRLAIGKVCGWEPCEPKVFLRHAPSHAFMKNGAYYGGFGALPQYIVDRNDIHQALRHLDDEQYLEFMLHLSDIVCIGMDASKWSTVRALLEATPAQMAEAFLKALNLWTGE